jgi:hypothetical protein
MIDQKNFALLRKFKVYCIQSAQAVAQKNGSRGVSTSTGLVLLCGALQK